MKLSSASVRATRWRGEWGSSVVAFLMGLPLILLFLFAIVDLGRTAFLYIAAQDSVHAACRVVASSPSGSVTDVALREAALAASPALARNELQLSVSARYGDREASTYRHRIYNGTTKLFEEIDRSTSRQEVEVQLELSGRYLTPLGPLFSAATGRGDAEFSYEVRSACVADATVEGGLQ